MEKSGEIPADSPLDYYVKLVLNGVMSELRFKHVGVHTELQGSRLGFNICVVPSSVKLGVLEFIEVGVGLELDWS